MEFIKRMKKREFIEMSLKTLVAVMAGFLAIILMEGMIYSIKLHALTTKGTSEMMINDSKTGTIAYCIKQDDDKYFVLCYNEGQEENGASSDWSSIANKFRTKAECEALEGTSVRKVVFGAPNAFTLSITSPVHYVVMSIFMAGIAGFFVYKFVRLGQSYKKIEEEYKKTGTIEISNM